MPRDFDIRINKTKLRLDANTTMTESRAVKNDFLVHM